MSPQEISRVIKDTINDYGLNYCKTDPEEVFIVPAMTFEKMSGEEFKSLFKEVAKINEHWKIYYDIVIEEMGYMDRSWLETAEI